MHRYACTLGMDLVTQPACGQGTRKKEPQALTFHRRHWQKIRVTLVRSGAAGRGESTEAALTTLIPGRGVVVKSEMAFTGSNGPNGGLGGSPLNSGSKAWYQARSDSSTSRTSLRQEAPSSRGRSRAGGSSSGAYWPSWVHLLLCLKKYKASSVCTIGKCRKSHSHSVLQPLLALACILEALACS